jgi:hypothetical protein
MCQVSRNITKFRLAKRCLVIAKLFANIPYIFGKMKNPSFLVKTIFSEILLKVNNFAKFYRSRENEKFPQQKAKNGNFSVKCLFVHIFVTDNFRKKLKGTYSFQPLYRPTVSCR